MSKSKSISGRSASEADCHELTRKERLQSETGGLVEGRKKGVPSGIRLLKCEIEHCTRTQVAKGLCMTHYSRMRKYGDVVEHMPIGALKFGAGNGRWKGGEIIDKSSGRVLIYAPNHPNPTANGTHVYRYRLVMEKHLGRYLTSDEIVHHKNGNCSDDRIENLELMSQSQHCKAHNFGGDNRRIKA